jgi:hypothetical protein
MRSMMTTVPAAARAGFSVTIVSGEPVRRFAAALDALVSGSAVGLACIRYAGSVIYPEGDATVLGTFPRRCEFEAREPGGLLHESELRDVLQALATRYRLVAIEFTGDVEREPAAA